MSIFGKSVVDYLRFMRIGLALLGAMVLLRFIVGISGVPYERATHLTSVTIMVFLLAIIHGQRAARLHFGGYRHLIPVALLLGGTMYGLILLAIAVEGLAGIPGFFHSPGSGYAPPDMEIAEHIRGQLSVMPTMTVSILGVTMLGYALSHHLAYLQSAFLLLTAMAVMRFMAAGIGIPYVPGSWLTSLSLLSVLVATYYGYRASAAGLDGWGHAFVIALVIAFVTFHLVIYGLVVSEGLGVETYDHASFMSLQEHIESRLRAAPWLVLALTAGASVGYAASKLEFWNRER